MLFKRENICLLIFVYLFLVLNRIHKHNIGHPCIADQSPDYRARLKEAAGGDMNAINEFQPVPPAQFLKYFSL